MRQSIVAVVALALVAGCTAVTTEDAATQSESATEASPLSRSLTITEVAAYQGLKATIAKNGATVPASLPLLAGRDAMVRVYVAPKSAPPEAVTALLEVTDADGDARTSYSETKLLGAASVESDLATTFNFTVPGSALPLGAKFRVTLTAANGTSTSGPSKARFPMDGGRADVGVNTKAQKLKIVYVPVTYAFGGVSLLPDTSTEQIDRIRRTFTQLYPVSDVEITMHAPYVYTTEIKSNGAGFGQLLREMLALRSQDNVAGDVYYYGSFQSKATFQEYCSGGCVTGLSGLYGPDATNGRASIGVGYTGSSSALTFAHEVGHAHGRPHAPCGGAAGPDPAFPDSTGGIGAWGYTPFSGKLVDPATAKDLMGYCQPKWISGYTYNKLLERLTYVNNAAEAAPPPGSFAVKHPYQFVEVSPEGDLSFGQHVKLAEDPIGEDVRAITFEDGTGRELGKAEAVFVPYDHIGGGYLLIPEDVEFSAVNIAGLGRAKR